MRLLPRLLPCLLPLLFVAPPALRSQSADPARPELMPVAEVKRGMKGYGLTVFQGGTIERFEVEILGVLAKTGAGADLILGKLSGGPLAETGVIAGMSGSPVYVNGRMIGAVAYAWGFSKSTIAGITPIHEMLGTFKYGQAGQAPEFKLGPGGKPEWNGQDVSWAGSSFRPVATPLICAGFRPTVFRRLAASFEKEGFLPVLGGGPGGEGTELLSTNFAPGSAIGVQLVGGDVSMTGVGTVTWTGPEGILAFGHPMMQRGHAAFPMATAWIHTVMPNLNVSFKLGSAVRVVGVIHQDRAPAIAGSYRLKPDTVPVALTLTQPGADRAYKFEIIRDDLLFARLFSSVVMSTLLESSAQADRLTYRLRYTFSAVETATGKVHKVAVTDSWAGFQNQEGYQDAIMKTASALQQLLFNRYAGVKLAGVDVRLEAVPDVQAMEISEVKADRRRVRPGETVKLQVRLTPWRGESFWRTLEMKVPESTMNAKLFLVVSPANHERYYDEQFAPARYEATTLAQAADLLNVDRDASKLVVWSELYQNGLVVDGVRLPNLPTSQAKVFSQGNHAQAGPLNGRLRRVYPTNYFLYGLQFVVLDMDYSSQD